MALGLLPEGGMKKFCKLVLGLLVVFMVLGILQPGLPGAIRPANDPLRVVAPPKIRGAMRILFWMYIRKKMENKNN